MATRNSNCFHPTHSHGKSSRAGDGRRRHRHLASIAADRWVDSWAGGQPFAARWHPPPPPAQRPFSFNFAPFHATSWHSPLLLIWFDWFMLSFVFFVMAVCVCVCVCVCVVEMVCYLIGSSRQLISNRWRYRGVSLINFIVVSREILRSWSRLSINYAHQLIDSSIHGMAMFLFMLMSPCCLLLALLQPPPQ